MKDPSWTVRRQLAATIGELPPAARKAPAIALLTQYGSDPILVDAAISSLKGMEGEVLQEVEAKTTAATADAVSMLARRVAKSGDVAAVQQVVARATDAATPAAQRTALLQGLDAGLPGAGGRGGRGGGGGRGAAPAKPVALAGEPAALMKLACGER